MIRTMDIGMEYKTQEIGQFSESWSDNVELFFKTTGIQYIATPDETMYKWNGKYWKRHLDKFVGDDIRAFLYLYKVDTPNNITKMRTMLNIMCAKEREGINLQQGLYLVFNNGSFNLKTAAFEENIFHQDLFRTSILPFDYPKNIAEEPTHFLKFLNTIFEGKQEMIDLMQKIFGYCLTDKCNANRFFLFYGNGGTGKSTLLNILTEMLGQDNVSTIDMNDLSKTFLRTELYGKKANICQEFDNDVNATNLVKIISEGGRIEAQYKFKESFFFNATCKMLFATNNLPTVLDKSDGFFRRLLLIKFNHSFFKEGTMINNFLEEYLIPELPLITYWAIQGLSKLIQDKYVFNEPEECKNFTKKFQIENDPVGTFLEENIIITNDESDYVKKEDLVVSFNNWAQTMGFRSMNAATFFKHFRRLTGLDDCQKRLEGGTKRVIKGIVFVENEDDAKNLSLDSLCRVSADFE